jgi:hypothetical protein
MRKFLLGTIGLVALGMAAPASAADLRARPAPPPPPPYVAPIYDWSGFYIGANGGWGQSRNCWDFVPVAAPIISDGCRERSGGLAGGQIGYRWQVRAIGRISATRASVLSIQRSRPARKLMASAFSPARSVGLGTRRCSM